MKQVSALFVIAAVTVAGQTRTPSRPAPAPRAAAQSSAPIKIGVVEVRRVLNGTNDGKKATAAMNAEFESRKNDLEKKKSAIGYLQLRLELNGNNLSPEERDDLQRDIDRQTREQNRLVDDMQAEVQQEEQKIVGQLRLKLVEVVRKYALANGFTLVVDNSEPLIRFEKRVDITAEIIDLFDKTPSAEPVPAGKK